MQVPRDEEHKTNNSLYQLKFIAQLICVPTDAANNLISDTYMGWYPNTQVWVFLPFRGSILLMNSPVSPSAQLVSKAFQELAFAVSFALPMVQVQMKPSSSKPWHSLSVQYLLSL